MFLVCLNFSADDDGVALGGFRAGRLGTLQLVPGFRQPWRMQGRC